MLDLKTIWLTVSEPG